MRQALLTVFLVCWLACFLTACSTTVHVVQPTPTIFYPTITQRLPSGTSSASPITPSQSQTPSPSASSTPLSITALPDPANFTWQPVFNGLNHPIGLFNAGDGSGRLFVIEQYGIIRIIQNGKLLSDPFLDIRDRVGSTGSEQGLLGLAFHPRYPENGLFYINYTDLHGDTIIARFSISVDLNRGDPASEILILKVHQPYPNHNGGMLAFGPDGYLYIGLGDGGSEGDPLGNGQALNTLLGKLLRIDVNTGSAYIAPPDNPFLKVNNPQQGLLEIWAYGLRNPWRFSFDRLTGDLYIGDVGQDKWEEIDFIPFGSPGGGNFGWNYREGTHRYRGSPLADLTFVEPVAEYDHSQGCSVSGGIVYRGQSLSAWQGVYLYGDYCSGKVWGLLPAGNTWQNKLLFETESNITAFGEDESGEVYLVDYRGSIYRLIQKTASLPPVRFAVIGDYGSGEQGEADVAALVKSWNPDFIITTGDNNYPTGSSLTIDKNIGQFFHEYIYPYIGEFGEGATTNRFFPCLGNHDWIEDEALTYLNYFALPGNERYYDFTWGVLHFFALDSDEREPDGFRKDSIQANWLQTRLSMAIEPWKIVYMHDPPYASATNGPVEWMRWPYQEWGADVVLSGHDHVFERFEVDGFPYLVNGLGGDSIYDLGTRSTGSLVFYNSDFGALLVDATVDSINFQFITRHGEVIDTYILMK